MEAHSRLGYDEEVVPMHARGVCILRTLLVLQAIYLDVVPEPLYSFN